MTNLFAWYPEAAWEFWLQFFKILLMTYLATMLIWGASESGCSS